MTGSGLPAILLTGGTGQVGRALRESPPQGFELVAPPRTELDLADPDALERWVAARPWAAIVNAGAWTAVDAAESSAPEAWAANARGPAALAKAIGARLVIPCHYEMFEFNTATTQEFEHACERLAQPYRVLRCGEKMELHAEERPDWEWPYYGEEESA